MSNTIGFRMLSCGMTAGKEDIEFYRKSLIDTCGYVPVYYPWDQRDLTDCFAALVVDRG